MEGGNKRHPQWGTMTMAFFTDRPGGDVQDLRQHIGAWEYSRSVLPGRTFAELRTATQRLECTMVSTTEEMVARICSSDLLELWRSSSSGEVDVWSRADSGNVVTRRSRTIGKLGLFTTTATTQDFYSANHVDEGDGNPMVVQHFDLPDLDGVGEVHGGDWWDVDAKVLVKVKHGSRRLMNAALVTHCTTVLTAAGSRRIGGANTSKLTCIQRGADARLFHGVPEMRYQANPNGGRGVGMRAVEMNEVRRVAFFHFIYIFQYL